MTKHFLTIVLALFWIAPVHAQTKPAPRKTLAKAAPSQAVQAQAAEVPVTLSQGTNMAAAVAPDGKQIVIDLQGTLWVMPIAGGVAKAITDPLMDARQPAWSPDSRTIVFQSYRDGGWHIWTVRADGMQLMQLTKGPQDDREPQFAPDGHAIAFSSDRRGNYDVFVMPAEGGEARAVTTSAANEFAPAWSPDSRQIAFISDQDKAAGLYVVSADGGPAKAVLAGTGLAAPSWNPDGKSLAFVAQSKDASRLRTVGADGGAASDFSAAAEDVFPFRVTWASPSTYLYTADGLIKRRDTGDATAKSIAFTATVNLVRTAYTPKVTDYSDSGSHTVLGIRAPQVSPDNLQIAFTALGDIWLEDIDPTHMRLNKQPKARRLMRDEFADYDPAWAPDGSQLAFISDRGGKPEIWLRDLKTNKDRQLTTTNENVALPSWSPDSKRIAFYKVAGLEGLGNMRLSVANVFTGDVQETHAQLAGPSRVAWSPDGKTLAVAAVEPSSSRFSEGVSKFLLISLTGAPDRFVSPAPDHALAKRGVNGPVWSPDGTMMAYIQDGLLWVVPVTPGGPHVGEIAGPPRALTTELAAAPSWTGNSKNIVFIATDRLKRIDLEGNVTDLQPNIAWGRNLPQGRSVLWAGRLWDGIAQSYRTNVDVVMDGNVISTIEPHRDGRTGVPVINASQDTVIPGLIESHTHVATPFGYKMGRVFLSFGITSIREPGADPYDALERRESWSSGIRPGPREFFAGGLFDGARVSFVGNESISSPAHLDLEMNRANTLGYDLIKTYERLSDDLQKTVVAKAHAIGIPVTSHQLYPAVAFDADGVEHLRGLSRLGYSSKQSELGFSYEDVVDLVAKSGIALTPTMVNQGGFALAALRKPALLQMPQYLKFYNDDQRDAIRAGIESQRPAMATLQRTITTMQQTVRQVVAHGGHVLVGTDAPGVPYGLSYLVELELLQEAGLTPLQVLQAATVWSAAALGHEKQLGTLEPGKLADMAIVGGDPLARTTDLANMRGVVVDGHYYILEELLRGR